MIRLALFIDVIFMLIMFFILLLKSKWPKVDLKRIKEILMFYLIKDKKEDLVFLFVAKKNQSFDCYLLYININLIMLLYKKWSK